MKSIGVYCGSNNGKAPAYHEAAQVLGTVLAHNNITLIYGGASVGLMGALADTVLNAGGNVVGIMPDLLIEQEQAHNGLTELIAVDSLHNRKLLMIERSDGFISLPGGFGTLDELFETLTLAQLNLHHKPCGLLNVNGYYDGLITFLDHAASQQFISTVDRHQLLIDSEPHRLITQMMKSVSLSL